MARRKGVEVEWQEEEAEQGQSLVSPCLPVSAFGCGSAEPVMRYRWGAGGGVCGLGAGLG